MTGKQEYEKIKIAIMDLLNAYEFDYIQKIGIFEDLKLDVMLAEPDEEIDPDSITDY
jgi:hypothetical protein